MTKLQLLTHFLTVVLAPELIPFSIGIAVAWAGRLGWRVVSRPGLEKTIQTTVRDKAIIRQESCPIEKQAKDRGLPVYAIDKTKLMNPGVLEDMAPGTIIETYGDPSKAVTRIDTADDHRCYHNQEIPCIPSFVEMYFDCRAGERIEQITASGSIRVELMKEGYGESQSMGVLLLPQQGGTLDQDILRMADRAVILNRASASQNVYVTVSRRN